VSLWGNSTTSMKEKVPMLPRRVFLRCSSRDLWQSLPPVSGTKPQRFFEPGRCVSSLRLPKELYRATRRERPFWRSESGSVPEADCTHDAGCQLRNIGKMIRKVIQEVVYKRSHGVENRLTLLRLGTWHQGLNVFSEIVKHPLKTLPRGFFLGQHSWQNWSLREVRYRRRQRITTSNLP
jgi:hypothetical protein